MTCLIPEDGTIVVGANTYITASEAETLLNGIGETFGDTPEVTIEQYLLKAIRTLESYRSKYQGSKVDSTQALQFPRYDVYIDKFLQGSDTIPTELKMAQAIIALLMNDGQEVQPTTDGRTVLQESIGNAISVTYANDGGNGNPVYPMLDTYLKPLLKSSSRTLQVYRP